MMKKLVNYFLQGLLFISPLALTAYILLLSFEFTDGLLRETLVQLLGHDIPGLGLLIIVLLLVLVGYFGQTFIARPIKRLIRKSIENIPVLNEIYSSLNDLFSAFVGEEKKFNRPVLVLINPDAKLEKLGFLTEHDLSILGEQNKVAVYFPHSYNFSGELFIVPSDQVRPIDISPTDVMKFIVSGGVSQLQKKSMD
ncbi:DUF502 domain-containing protein [Undibacterium sp.]|uniref:DUF502 domain-containing protein n=1 Tax=Undibacterium sp. TaxID=1914977 RepID=UPI003750E7E6